MAASPAPSSGPGGSPSRRAGCPPYRSGGCPAQAVAFVWWPNSHFLAKTWKIRALWSRHPHRIRRMYLLGANLQQWPHQLVMLLERFVGSQTEPCTLPCTFSFEKSGLFVQLHKGTASANLHVICRWVHDGKRTLGKRLLGHGVGPLQETPKLSQGITSLI